MYPALSERVHYIQTYDANNTPFNSSGECYSIPVPQNLLKNVVGLMLFLTDNTVYDSSLNYDESDSRIQEIYRIIGEIEACMNCDDVIACMTSSVEYGVVARQSLNSMKAQWQAENDYAFGLYDGTPQSIVPSLTNLTMSTTNQDSVNRLCQAVRFFVDEYRAKKRAEIEYALYGAMALAGIALALTAATFGVFTLIGSIVIGANVIAGVALTEALAAINDDVQYETVICEIVNAAHEDTLSFGNFELWLNAANSTIFGQLLANDCAADFGSFYGFCQWFEYMKNASIASWTEDCNCVDLTIQTEFDFSTGNQNGFVILGGSMQSDGIRPAWNYFNNNQWGCRVEYTFPQVINVDSVYLRLKAQAAGGVGSGWNFVMYNEANAVITSYSTNNVANLFQQSWNYAGSVANVKKIRVEFRHRGDPDTEGKLQIVNIGVV